VTTQELYVVVSTNGATYHSGFDTLQLTELAMCQLSATLRTKEEWWVHFLDPDTRNSWAEEALEREWKVRIPSSVVIDVQLSKGQVCILNCRVYSLTY
jgi:hypothetical protein